MRIHQSRTTHLKLINLLPYENTKKWHFGGKMKQESKVHTTITFLNLEGSETSFS